MMIEHKMTSPIASIHGSLTASNPMSIGGKKGSPYANLAVYSDRLVFHGKGISRFVLSDITVHREEIGQIYPLVIRRSLFRWHPFLAGKSFVRITTKCSDVYKGSFDYWFLFRKSGMDDMLDILASAGYPVDRVPRLAGLLSGVDRRLPG
jgi:hypothetical protein